MLFAAPFMDLEIIILSEVRKTKINIIWYHSHVASNFKKWYKWIYLQNRNRLTDIENKLMITNGKTWAGRGIDQEFGIKIHTLPYMR